jgi:O-antigen/teichoic acid export membrane protein
MIGQGALVFSASMFFNVCGFVFHMIAARRLGPDVYGSLYALMSTMVVVTLPASIFAPVVAKFAAEFQALHDDSHVRGLTTSATRGSLIIGSVLMIVGLVAMRWFGSFLHVPPLTVVLVAAMAAVALLSAILRSIAQGTQSYVSYSVSITIEGIARVGLLVALVAFGLTGGIWSVLLAAAIGCAAIGAALLARYRSAPERAVTYDWKRIAAATGGAAAAACAATFFGNIDVIIVAHNFPAFEAGIYASAALGGKILLFLVTFIATVLLPQAADKHARGERTQQAFVIAMVMFAALSIVGLLVLRFAGSEVIGILAGAKYMAAVPLLSWYGLAMVFLALTGALCSYGIATHRLAFGVPVVACTAITLVAIALSKTSLQGVVMILVVGTAVTAASAGVAIGAQALWPRPVPEPT